MLKGHLICILSSLPEEFCRYKEQATEADPAVQELRFTAR